MSANGPTSARVAAYIPIPSSAVLIPPPSIEPLSKETRPVLSSQDSGASTSHAIAPSFPPSTSNPSLATSSRKGGTTTGIGSIGISTNVSDLLLSSLLPPGLPKLPSSTTASSGPGLSPGAGAKDGKGLARPRELSTVREGLRLDVMSNNFRRFVTKVGPVFWLQDRVEEVLFWRKPTWTWAWLMAWAAISFQPRLLLCAPFFILLLVLLHINERLHPVKTLFGVRSSVPAIGTARIPAQKVFKESSANGSAGASTTGGLAGAGSGGGLSDTSKGQGVSVTTGPDGEALPAVPPREAESGVDYFMNLQAIQNTMGWVSDAYDDIAPILSALTHPSTSHTSLPISSTSLILALLPPTALLPLTPGWMIPYLLLPIGWGPTLIYHPHLAPLLRSLPRSPLYRRLRAIVTDLLLTDALSDDIGRRSIQRVEVWENERLDPAVTAKPPTSTSVGGGGGVPPGSWSYRHLRAGERLPWVKVTPKIDSRGHMRRTSGSTVASYTSDRDEVSSAGTAAGTPSAGGPMTPWLDPHDTLPRPAAAHANVNGEEGTAAALKLKEGWKWVPREEWMVDLCAEWSEGGADEEGWVYSDDSWQNLAPVAMIEADTTGPMPAQRRPTRRRKWWRRVYFVPVEETA